MHAAHFRAHNKIIFPPTLRLLPLWTLGEATWLCDSDQRHCMHCSIHKRLNSTKT